MRDKKIKETTAFQTEKQTLNLFALYNMIAPKLPRINGKIVKKNVVDAVTNEVLGFIAIAPTGQKGFYAVTVGVDEEMAEMREKRQNSL